jgi:hypothetical protein
MRRAEAVGAAGDEDPGTRERKPRDRQPASAGSASDARKPPSRLARHSGRNAIPPPSPGAASRRSPAATTPETARPVSGSRRSIPAAAARKGSTAAGLPGREASTRRSSSDPETLSNSACSKGISEDQHEGRVPIKHRAASARRRPSRGSAGSASGYGCSRRRPPSTRLAMKAPYRSQNGGWSDVRLRSLKCEADQDRARRASRRTARRQMPRRKMTVRTALTRYRLDLSQYCAGIRRIRG